MTTLDLRQRCNRQRCNKLIRQGKAAQAEYARYAPFCSYSCQEWGRLEDAMRYVATIPDAAKFSASDQAVNGSRYARAMQLQIDRPSELDNATWRRND